MIQIKTPCDANWKEMTPAESGKYCGACEKVVVDFSRMNDAQIKVYFTEYATQKTCGRFLDSQLDRPLVVPPSTQFNRFLNRLNQIPVTRTLLFFVTSVSMWVSSCVKNNNDDGRTTGDSVSVVDMHNTQLVKDDTTPVVKQEGNLLLIKPDNQVTGEVTLHMLPPNVLMGDVCVTPPNDKPDTVAVTFPAITPDTTVTKIELSMGAVMMVDTISQKIKRKRK